MYSQKRYITLGTTYYNNIDLLKNFIDRNISYVDELVIVDDGSEHHAEKYIKYDKKIKLYRVTKDYGFNSHGCRNLIMKESSNDWVVLLDIDRKFDDPQFSFETFKTKKISHNTRYCFEAYTGNYQNIHQSVNDYLIHRDHFFSVGGYDEELIGYRDGDRQFFQQLLHHGNEKIIHGVMMSLIRSPSTRINDALAVSPNDKGKIPRFIDNVITSRINKPDPNKSILTFEWKRVF